MSEWKEKKKSVTGKQGFYVPAVEGHVDELRVASRAWAQDRLHPARQEVLAEGPTAFPCHPQGRREHS